MAYRTLFVLTLAFLSHSLAAPAAHLSFKLSQTASRFTPENRVMNPRPPPQSSSTTSISPSTPTSPNTFTTQVAETTYCRQMHLPPSKCVDPPAFKHEEVDFCPYRLCAPKYVEAVLCPADQHLAAEAKCYEEEITRDVYKCDDIFEKTKLVPPGCSVGEGECREVQHCSCFKVPEVKTKQLKFLAIFEPYCGPVH